MEIELEISSAVRSSRQEVFCKKEALAQVISYEFCKISKNSFFLKNTSDGCLWAVNITKSAFCHERVIKLAIYREFVVNVNF